MKRAIMEWTIILGGIVVIWTTAAVGAILLLRNVV
jgi:hypothetical protein